MYTRLLLAAFLFISIAGCKSKSAFNYSQDIIKKERSLIPDIHETEAKVKKFIGTEQFDSIAVAGAHMESLVQEKIDEIKAMPVPKAKKADEFKKGILRYFDYIKSMYTSYKEWGNAKTPEDRDVVLQSLQKIVDGKQDAIREMQNIQKDYASANGFKVE